ncbi:MAG: hypothetical protein FWG74_05375, partial [Planctomycetes bacterium]|nr:hypothetical protein [Planctomycetota bacterium]
YIPAEVRSGTFRDALLFAAGANAGHGLRRTNADKRRAVEMLLGEPECVGWSNEQIARHCRVGPHLVAEIRTGHLCENRDEASEAISAKTEMNAPSTRTVTRGGITYQMKTDNIGKRQAPGPVARDEKTATAPWRGSHPVYNAVGLLPCPFCGAQGPDFAHGPEGHAACCPHPDCNVVGPRKPTRDEAREGWNRRA